MTATPLTDTWAGVLLDGLVGGLLGAAATILVVVATIRHERRMREADRLDDAIATAHAASQAFGFLTHTPADLTKPENFSMLTSMLQSTVTALTRAQRSEPKLAALLEHAASDLSDVTRAMDHTRERREQLQASVLRMQVALGRWLANPDDIRNGKLDYAGVRKLASSATEPSH